MKKYLLALVFSTFLAYISYSQSISANTTSGCYPLTVNFNGSGAGSVGQYYWYFGDGTSANVKTPSHTYTEPGQYWVHLDVYTATGTYVGYDDVEIIVEGGSNKVWMTKDSVCVNEEISIYNAGQADSYMIDYGDGSPVETNTWGSFWHEYTTPGTKYITYTYISQACGNYVVLDTVFVGTNLPVTDAYLQLDPHTVCPGDEVSFWTNWEYSWVIDFGDGNTSSTDYYHSYAQTGTYIVTATVQNGCGNVGYATDTVVVQNNVPFFGNAYFWYPNATCPGSQVDLGAPSGYSGYHWNFGNGNTSNDQYPSFSFPNTGTFPVALTITNGCGNDTTVTNNITINNSTHIQYAELDIPDSVCLGEALMYDADGDNVDTYDWNFGDGNNSSSESGSHTYQSAGIYFVSCTMNNGCNNDTTVYETVYVGPNVGINPSNLFVQVYPEEACPGDTVLFIAFPGGTPSVYNWDFGDGGSSSNGEDIVINNEIQYNIVDHSYAANGTYTVHFTATNTCGYTYSDSTDIVIGPGAVPDPAILYNTDAYNCLGAELTFMGVGGSTMLWNFGDGTGNLVDYGTLEPVPHIYTQPGTYNVTLTATNNCGLSGSADLEIFIPDNGMNLVTTSVKSHCLQSDGKAIVSISGGTPPYSISWSSGATGNIAEDLPAGIYFVTVTDANGCTAEAVATVSDQEAPTIVLNAQIDVSCHGGNDGAIDVNLIGSSAPYDYSWSSGSAGQDINNLIAGPYELLVTDANGCISAESFDIQEPDPVFVSFTGTPADCGVSNGTATVNVNGNTGPYLYSWDNGQSSATLTGLGAGVYSTNVIDANGCLYSGVTTVSEKTAPYIIVDSTVQVGCGGSVASIYINPLGSTGPYTYLWSNGSVNEDLLNVSAGSYNVMVTGNNGCTSVAHFDIDEFSPEPNQICMVTVNPITNTNKVIWEKNALDPAISSFNIYKESSQSGVYYLVGNVPVDSLSEFVDLYSDPVLRAWRYKITTIDSCGNESSRSTHHKTLHLTSNVGVGGEINLIWDGYVGFSFSSYNIWRYSDVDGWNMIQSLPHTLTSYTDIAPPTGASSLHYYLEAIPDVPCVSSRANHNTTRSNRSAPIGGAIVTSVPGVQNLNVSVYPNPTTGLLYITLDPQAYSSLMVMDASGKLVMSEAVTNDVSELNMNGFERGMYYIQIIGDDNVVTKKVILTR